MTFADRHPHSPEPTNPDEPLPESPRHGFRGDRPTASTQFPTSVTIAVSREAGSRGNSIGTRVGQKLGWPVYNHEVLQYVAQEGTARQSLFEDLSPEARTWVEDHLAQLTREQTVSQHRTVIDLARSVLSLSVQGEVVLVGRGAGCLLPPASTLHVRIVAPLADRIAYMGQWLRLSVEEATRQVQVRDQQRADYLATHFHRDPEEVYQYALVLNSSLLGEDLCADLIVQAARAKLASLDERRQGESPASSTPSPGD